MSLNRRTFLGVSAAAGLAGVWQPEAAAVGSRGHFPSDLVEAARQAVATHLQSALVRVSIGIPDELVRACGGRQPAFTMVERFLCDVHAIVGPFDPARIVTSGGSGSHLMVHGLLRPGLQILAATGSMSNTNAYISVRGKVAEVMLSREIRLHDARGMRVIASASEATSNTYGSMPPSVEALLTMARQSWAAQRLVESY